ncbi:MULTISPECIES: hypothetical protein [Variovorax]|uniref:hypothetical protein n=1 Tax=Variovorax TaxID=34072 RepID=UPI002862E0E7|nr:hypothetical protein [Variovorax sp. 3319]MDR6890922.1 hypothetical protein [Variovorax sp. 3319]
MKDLDNKGGTEEAEGTQEAGANADRRQTAHPGETRWSQASGDGLQRPVPQQPNELDESASSQAAASPSMVGIGQAAYHDTLTSEDTDRGPVMDTVYNGPVTEGRCADDEEEVRGGCGAAPASGA